MSCIKYAHEIPKFNLAGKRALVVGVFTKATAEGVIIGSVCHGALGLFDSRHADGTPLLDSGYETSHRILELLAAK